MKGQDKHINLLGQAPTTQRSQQIPKLMSRLEQVHEIKEVHLQVEEKHQGLVSILYTAP